MGFINCRTIPAKKEAVFSSVSKSELDFHIFHARYSIYTAPRICIKNLTFGSALYKVELNKVHTLMTIRNPAVIPRLKRKLFRKLRRAALLLSLIHI